MRDPRMVRVVDKGKSWQGRDDVRDAGDPRLPNAFDFPISFCPNTTPQLRPCQRWFLSLGTATGRLVEDKFTMCELGS